MSTNLSDATVTNKHSSEEWRLRVELAACYRLVHHFGMTDLVYNHITVRLPAEPGQPDVFLINEWGLDYSEIKASNLIRADVDGNVLESGERQFNPAGFVIHSAIHAARADINCIVHTHSLAGCAVSSLAEGLVPLDLQSLQFHNRVAYHELEGITVDLSERERLVHSLGDMNIMILRNHGLLAAGRSVGEAFRRIYYLERACKLQLEVMQTGRAIHQPSAQVAEHTARQYEVGVANQGTIDPIEWRAMLRLMELEQPDFKT